MDLILGRIVVMKWKETLRMNEVLLIRNVNATGSLITETTDTGDDATQVVVVHVKERRPHERVLESDNWTSPPI